MTDHLIVKQREKSVFSLFNYGKCSRPFQIKKDSSGIRDCRVLDSLEATNSSGSPVAFGMSVS